MKKNHSVDRGAVALNKLFPDLDLKFQMRGEIYIYIYNLYGMMFHSFEVVGFNH